VRIDASYTRLASVYDDMVVDPCYDRWAQFIHTAWSADPTRVRTVLDVGCGTGLMTAELVELGYDVTGVDASTSMLAQARRRLGPNTTLARVNLPDLPIDGPFDGAVSTFDVLNYLSPSQLRETAGAVAAVLRPGGWFVFDLHTDAMMEFALANPIVSGDSHGRHFRLDNDVDTVGREVTTRIEVSGSGDTSGDGGLDDGLHTDGFREVHRQYFFTDHQIRASLGAAGLSIMSVSDEYSSQPVEPGSLRATWVSRRPE
jgi:SAM-dependent methyltransferase